jgi:hypothetical protein
MGVHDSGHLRIKVGKFRINPSKVGQRLRSPRRAGFGWG